ncbi:hypothetical protein EMWEY_00042650 [Eimeria maxima]|uniref:Uncharacterized protein n=1 Tax=Eimeria maxima TaxID=5804 RepID=U6MC45_EIMMA|nr:hypothetical protein EMWEY_00042650 [Eimeria maxima]CDJ61586.1 hypothetical protein EMWEY_00042650 [Eimeria maxima]
MEDLLGLLHFRDFATLLQLQQQQQQRGQQQPSQQLQRFPAKQLISCCLPVLLQLHDSYSSPCNSLKVLVSQFSTREVDASRRLHRLAAPAAAAGAAAAAPAVTAATTVTSATAETTKAVTAATAATTDDEVATTEGDLAGSAQQHKMSCLWEVGGPLGPTDEAVSEQALGAVLNRFKADTSAFAAAASAAAGPCAATAGPAETGIVAAGIKVWGPFLPLLLPILYPLLPSSISEQSDAEGVHGRQDQGQQTSRQERPQGAPSIPHSVKGPLAEETASATAAPVAALALVSAPGGTKQEASAAAAATVSATAPAAPSSTTRAGALATAEVTATRRAALCLCAAALMWWGRQKLGGPTAEAEEHARVLLLGPAFADAELALAKPFLSLILNSPTTQDALTACVFLFGASRIACIWLLWRY